MEWDEECIGVVFGSLFFMLRLCMFLNVDDVSSGGAGQLIVNCGGLEHTSHVNTAAILGQKTIRGCLMLCGMQPKSLTDGAINTFKEYVVCHRRLKLAGFSRYIIGVLEKRHVCRMDVMQHIETQFSCCLAAGKLFRMALKTS